MLLYIFPLIFSSYAFAQLSLPLPPLTGSSLVGTVSLELLDTTRVDPLAPTPQNRDLMLSVYYPVQHIRHYSPAPAYDPAYAAFLDSSLGIPPGLAEAVLSQAYTGAYLHPSSSSQPRILLFSPGYGNSREDYVGTLSNLASQGYIVVGVDHPYDTTFISYPGNRTAVRYTDLNNAPDIPAEATRLAGIRSDDLIAVLHALSKNATFARQIPGAHGKLDVSSIGIFGHSLGGAAALDAMGKHPRVTCGANLDGAFWGDVAASARALKNRPFLVMAAEGHNSTNDESFRSFFGNTTASGPFGGKYLATTRGAVHNTFADLAYLYETAKAAGLPVPDVEEFGSIGGVRMLELVSMFLGEFFGRCLNGQGNILKGLEGLTRKFPEVRVE